MMTFFTKLRFTVLRFIRSKRRPGVATYHVHTTFQRLDLALDAGTTVHWENLQVVDILGVVVQVVCDL